MLSVKHSQSGKIHFRSRSRQLRKKNSLDSTTNRKELTNPNRGSKSPPKHFTKLGNSSSNNRL